MSTDGTTPRRPGSNSRGGGFDHQTVLAVWNKAKIDSRYNSGTYRADACGHWIAWADYGKTSGYGWEIDHIKPVAKGGTDDLSNLQALYWENNRQKSDDWPNWSCKS